MSYVQLSERGFQVVYPLGLLSRSLESSKSYMDMASKLFTSTSPQMTQHSTALRRHCFDAGVGVRQGSPEIKWNFCTMRGCMQAINTHRCMCACHPLRHVAECWRVHITKSLPMTRGALAGGRSPLAPQCGQHQREAATGLHRWLRQSTRQPDCCVSTDIAQRAYTRLGPGWTPKVASSMASPVHIPQTQVRSKAA